MQNPVKKNRQNYYFREIGYSVWKIENFDELQLTQSWILFAETFHTSSNYQCLQKSTNVYNVYKRVFGIFLFCLDLDLFAKSKIPGFYTLFLPIFINNLRSKQNKKIPNIFCTH